VTRGKWHRCRPSFPFFFLLSSPSPLFFFFLPPPRPVFVHRYIKGTCGRMRRTPRPCSRMTASFSFFFFFSLFFPSLFSFFPLLFSDCRQSRVLAYYSTVKSHCPWSANMHDGRWKTCGQNRLRLRSIDLVLDLFSLFSPFFFFPFSPFVSSPQRPACYSMDFM